jgi:hypothetical protein
VPISPDRFQLLMASLSSRIKMSALLRAALYSHQILCPVVASTVAIWWKVATKCRTTRFTFGFFEQVSTEPHLLVNLKFLSIKGALGSRLWAAQAVSSCSPDPEGCQWRSHDAITSSHIMQVQIGRSGKFQNTIPQESRIDIYSGNFDL